MKEPYYYQLFQDELDKGTKYRDSFVADVQFNDYFLNDLCKKCIVRQPFEIEQHLNKYGKLDYIYHLVFAVFSETPEKPNYKSVGFDNCSKMIKEILHSFWQYFYDKDFGGHWKLPLLPNPDDYRINITEKTIDIDPLVKMLMDSSKKEAYDILSVNDKQETQDITPHAMSEFLDDSMLKHIDEPIEGDKSTLDKAIATNQKHRSSNNVDVSKLKVGIKEKYPKMCELLGQEVKGGRQKELQVKDWGRYFLFKKEGTIYTVKEIYDVPKQKPDGRGGNNSIYIDDVERVLLDLLYTNDNTLLLSVNQLAIAVGFININYSTGRKNKTKLSEIIGVNKEIVTHFYNDTYSKIDEYLQSALNRLQKTEVIQWEKVIAISTYDEEIKEADDDESQTIIDSENEVLKKMGRKNIGEVVFLGQWEYFSRQVCQIARKNLPLKYYYRPYKVLYQSEEKIIPMDVEARISYRQKINRNFLERLNRAFESKHKDTKQSDDILSQLFGSVFEAKINYTDESYVESMTKLTKAVIDIESDNIRIK
jgi:hypothetical protein